MQAKKTQNKILNKIKLLCKKTKRFKNYVKASENVVSKLS